MSTLSFIGNGQTRKRKTPYDIAVEGGFVGTEQQYEVFCHGLTVAQVTLYKRSETQPDDYSSDGGSTVRYTFSNGSADFFPTVTPIGSENPSQEGWYEFVNSVFVQTTDTSVVSWKTYYSKETTDKGWRTSPYTDDGDLYVIYASANSKDSFDIIPPTEWSIPAIMSEEAAKGEDGNNVCIVFIYKASDTDPRNSRPSQTTNFTFSTGEIQYLNNNWSKDAPNADKVWVSTAIAISKTQSADILASAWSLPTIWKERGNDGISVTGTEDKYACNDNEETAPTREEDWKTFAEAAALLDEDHKFLWNKEIVTYSDGSSDSLTPHIVYRFSQDGAPGVSLKRIENQYAYGGSSQAPSSGWDYPELIPTQQNQYVWQRERTVFDTTPESFGQWTIGHMLAMYIKGDPGKGISEVKYGKSSSESSEPENWYSSAPPVSQGDWLWVKTKYTDNTLSYTKSYIGNDGDDGISVFVKSASKVGKTTTVVLEDTTGAKTTMTIIDGDDGNDGHDGLNGYIHYAWANDNHGTDFSTSVSEGKTWIGVYEDQGSTRPADSQDYHSYSWTEIKGDPGVSITNTVDEYAVNNNDTTAPQSGWDTFDNVKSQLGPNNKYLWNREIVYYDDVPAAPLSAHIIYRVSTDAKNIKGVHQQYAYGSESTPDASSWSDSQKTPSQLHPYVWERERIIYEDDTEPTNWGTAHILTMWIKGDPGENANVLDVYLSSQTYVENVRLTGNTDIDCTVALQGVHQSGTFYVKDGSGTAKLFATKKNGTSITATDHVSVVDGDVITVSVPYGTTFIVCVSLISNTANTIKKEISPVDETEYNHDFGGVDSLPTSYTDSSGRTCSVNNGDFFVAIDDFDSYEKGTTYEYSGTWLPMATNDSSKTAKFLSALNSLKKAKIQFSELNNPNTTSWFVNVIADTFFANFFFSKNITVENEDGTFRFRAHAYNSEGTKLQNPIFDIMFNNEPIFKVDPEEGKTTMKNAFIEGDFLSDGLATSKATENTQIFTFRPTQLQQKYKSGYWCAEVAPVVESNYDSMQWFLDEDWQALINAGANPDWIPPRPTSISTFSQYYQKNVSGSFDGKQFTKINYPGNGSRSEAPGFGVVIDNELWICNIDTFNDDWERVKFVTDTNKTSVTIGSTTYSWADQGIYMGYYLSVSDLQSLLNTYRLPSGTELQIKSATTASANGVVFNPASQKTYIVITSSHINIFNTDANDRVVNDEYINADSCYDASAFSFADIEVYTSLDGIKTKHIVPWSDSNYEIGTPQNKYKRIYSEEFHGTAYFS